MARCTDGHEPFTLDHTLTKEAEEQRIDSLCYGSDRCDSMLIGQMYLLRVHFRVFSTLNLSYVAGAGELSFIRHVI